MISVTWLCYEITQYTIATTQEKITQKSYRGSAKTNSLHPLTPAYWRVHLIDLCSYTRFQASFAIYNNGRNEKPQFTHMNCSQSQSPLQPFPHFDFHTENLSHTKKKERIMLGEKLSGKAETLLLPKWRKRMLCFLNCCCCFFSVVKKMSWTNYI